MLRLERFTISPLAVGSDREAHAIHSDKLSAGQRLPASIVVFMLPHVFRARGVATTNHRNQGPRLPAESTAQTHK